MNKNQKTLKEKVSLSGVGLHTGHKVAVTFKPAEENSGIRFIRTDLSENVVIKAGPENVVTEERLPRCTSIRKGDAVIHTVEHLMGVLSGLGVDNLEVEINGDELPGMDGSGKDFLQAFKAVGFQEQKAAKKYFYIAEPIGIERNGASVFIVPADDLRISYTLNYDHPFLRAQFFSVTITEETFEKEVAPSRTFCLEEEAEKLREMGLGRGANYSNTLVVGEKGVKENTVRFENEFARHKVLDFIGDLYLMGMPLRGHVFAVKSGHSLNLEVLKQLIRQKEDSQSGRFVPDYNFIEGEEIDIQRIMKILPHRYPFLFVDRIVELEKGKRVVGIKNVTINDQFFQGHFPSRPMMPGVLMIEAMAQTAGIAVLSHANHLGKIAFFMGADKIKFRKVVVPGDQLVMEAEVIRDRSKTAMIQAKARVGGEIVAEAEMLFSFTDASYLD